jgi:adenosylhomocysteine nucleosidase
LTLTTGDAFIADAAQRAELAAHADLVDMEGYAYARVCHVLDMPIRLVKQVSDQADGSAGKSWRETVDECAEILGAWVRTHL